MARLMARFTAVSVLSFLFAGAGDASAFNHVRSRCMTWVRKILYASRRAALETGKDSSFTQDVVRDIDGAGVRIHNGTASFRFEGRCFENDRRGGVASVPPA